MYLLNTNKIFEFAPHLSLLMAIGKWLLATLLSAGFIRDKEV